MRDLAQFFETLDDEEESEGTEDDSEGDVSSFENPNEARVKYILEEYERLRGFKIPFELFVEDPSWKSIANSTIYRCPFWKINNDPIIKHLMETLEFVITINVHENNIYGLELELMIWGNRVVSGMLEYGIVDGKMTLTKVDGKYVEY